MAEPRSQGPDFYCAEVLSGRTPVQVAVESDGVPGFHQPRPRWPVHIVVIPKRHVESLIALDASGTELLVEMVGVIREIAERIVAEHGGCRVIANLGDYQTNKHLRWHVVSDSTLM